ncbi:MAG: hypothetical protein LBP92_07770 [Deltaproteobacteria bacterium]|jgi:rhodanese-related sulfurtransferase|nr:hypothetical protein [Deltaproteobacteria bacterium]
MDSPIFATPAQLDQLICASGQLAILDLRERRQFFREHFLRSASIPLGRLELSAPTLVPGRGTTVVLIDQGGETDGLAVMAARRLRELGYADVRVLRGGLDALKAAGRVLFSGVGTLCKAFGEWVAETYRTPFIGPLEFQRRREEGEKFLLIDCRPYAEYHTMAIPGSQNSPGVDLLPAIMEAVGTDQDCAVVVNCAGRTRGIIAAQSLINAGLDRPVLALRNGTMGWQLAGLELAYGLRRRLSGPGPEALARARTAAGAVARKFGVRRLRPGHLLALMEERSSALGLSDSLFVFDVRSEEEYALGHLPGSANVPGGQLVQELDAHVGVFGAKIALVDDDSVRAVMTASWLVQLGWSDVVAVSFEPGALAWGGLAPERATGGRAPDYVWPRSIGPVAARELIAGGGATVLDFSPSRAYRAGHIPGALWLSRSEAFRRVPGLGPDGPLVVTSGNGRLASLAARDLSGWLGGGGLLVLEGGNGAWQDAGLGLTDQGCSFLSEPQDDWDRPYLDPESPREQKEAYFQWEYDLVGQLAQEGSLSFKVYG